MDTKIILRLLLSCVILVVNHVDKASGVGSKTYETTNGFPTTFLSDIVNNDVIRRKLNSRWRWEVWDVVPGTHAYQIYVFNITNPDQVEKGEKPALQQLGPYYYKEYRYKFDVSMNLDLSVNFERNFSYAFDEKRSKGSESDLVNSINVPFVVFATLAAKYSKNPTEANLAVAALLKAGESVIRKNVKVSDLLFHGVNTSIYTKYMGLLGPETPLTEEFHDGFQSILRLKNGAHEGQFTMDSGLKKPSQVGNILAYNGNDVLHYWDGDTCNKIEGSDGSVFPPTTQTSDSLHMLEVDLCRSISFEYANEVPYKSVTGRLYVISKSAMEDPSVSPSNECFCRKDGKESCLKKGVLDVSRCQFDAPYVMSYAHFLDASPEYQQAVTGLHPDPKLHQTELTIEPVTGAVLTFNKRYQWNIWIKPLAGIDYFKKFHSMIVPVLWNDDIFNLDADKEELLMEELANQAGGMWSGSPAQKDISKTATIALFIIVGVVLIGGNHN